MTKKEFQGIKEAEQEQRRYRQADDEPDFIANAPNYDKFKDWTPWQVLVWLNID